jgi:glycosyltransferase involved in cell wall biosynthesis
MGKKNKRPNNNQSSVSGKSEIKFYPFVSVCTVTFNRRPFWKTAFEIFKSQDYPKNRIEWVILDDGTDKIGDLINEAKIPQIKYIEIDKKMSLGAKRNLSHTHCKGSIIVYMDDDDYYPPDRVSHAVERLTSSSTALCAGSSELYLYFKHINQLYQCGPYSPTHATAGTFAFKRELLDITKYEDNAAVAEEKPFLKNYTIPFIQLDPLKTILVVSHTHNTFDKRNLLENANPNFLKPSDKSIDMFIRGNNSGKIKKFFMEDVEPLLEKYEAGTSKYKPDSVKQIADIQKKRNEMMNATSANENPHQTISMVVPGKGERVLTQSEVLSLINNQKQYIENLQFKLNERDTEILRLKQELSNIGNNNIIIDVDDIKCGNDHEYVNVDANTIEDCDIEDKKKILSTIFE